MQVENYKNGLKVGDYYQYFEDGTLATKGFFVNGKEEGIFELYNREGKKFKELVFKKGKKIEEREEVGKKYAEYKRNLKKWIESLKDNEIINLLIN